MQKSLKDYTLLFMQEASVDHCMVYQEREQRVPAGRPAEHSADFVVGACEGELYQPGMMGEDVEG